MPERHVSDVNVGLVLAELKRVSATTQSELVRRTGLTRPTVAAIVTDLAAHGRIIRRGRQQTGDGRGRPSELLSLKQPEGHVAAIDIGHTHLNIALATTNGDIIEESRIEFDADASGSLTIATAAHEVRALMSKSGIDNLRVAALGVPGPLRRSEEDQITSGGVMSGWAGLEPRLLFQEKLGAHPIVTLDNDAHLGAIGEHAYGAARGYANALYVKVGAGIGAGIIIDHLLYRGGHGTSGEIGHVRVVAGANMCRCGGRGCLETIASTTFAVQSLQQIHGPALDIQGVATLLSRGDLGATRLVEEMGHAIGQVVASSASTLDPEIIVVGSPIAGPSPLTAGVQHAVERNVQPFLARQVKVVAGQLCERAALMGAVARATRMVRTALG